MRTLMALAAALDTMAQQLFQLELTSNRAGGAAQDQVIAQIRENIPSILADLDAHLHKPPDATGKFERFKANILRSRYYSKAERINITNLYVNAALIQFYAVLFFIRWHAAATWYEQSSAFPSLVDEVNQALQEFDAALKKAHVHLSALNFHTMATAFRSWADDLSPAATRSSGWLEAAQQVSRLLRYRYHHYRTLESWRLILVGGDIGAGPTIHRFLRALGRSLYGLVAGYGLYGARFAYSAVGIVLTFGAAFWILDAHAGCSNATLTWQHALSYLFTSLNGFTGAVGRFDAGTDSVCTVAAPGRSELGIVESLFGYLMLGLLASLFWSAFHGSTLEVSGVRLPEEAAPEDKGLGQRIDPSL